VILHADAIAAPGRPSLSGLPPHFPRWLAGESPSRLFQRCVVSGGLSDPRQGRQSYLRSDYFAELFATSTGGKRQRHALAKPAGQDEREPVAAQRGNVAQGRDLRARHRSRHEPATAPPEERRKPSTRPQSAGTRRATRYLQHPRLTRHGTFSRNAAVIIPAQGGVVTSNTARGKPSTGAVSSLRAAGAPKSAVPRQPNVQTGLAGLGVPTPLSCPRFSPVPQGPGSELTPAASVAYIAARRQR
jgi:hypothetical protein